MSIFINRFTKQNIKSFGQKRSFGKFQGIFSQLFSNRHFYFTKFDKIDRPSMNAQHLFFYYFTKKVEVKKIYFTCDRSKELEPVNCIVW